MDIKNSVVLVTSAGSVLGSTLARHFATLGAKVIVTDEDKFALEQTVKRCQEFPLAPVCYPLENCSFDNVQKLFDDVESSLDRSIDVVINYWPSQPFPSLVGSTDERELSSTISKLTCPFFSFGQAGADHMRNQQKNGVIINLVTYEEETNTAGMENTSTLISGFTKSWAKELHPFNIRVGGVIPTLTDKSKGEKDIEHWAQLQDELIRSTEYIIANEYFTGRVMAA
ncbi:SDR family oxidoreductase [Vibrio sp. SCSIO 43137]|uniref:SDR family oxidoreductase n=1 Tax=Vibrio sp. SCSIO 43137 TaxID=3021011 RepID=UPI002307F5D3|nr:SDR family oxidoreductase [Vibrio sp. SCSIO 43137]WCE28773.1 SDR family oxidoreductase [Vibrio sp. SCSIO 43137]